MSDLNNALIPSSYTILDDAVAINAKGSIACTTGGKHKQACLLIPT
jgi:hypothetical protein